MLILYYNNTYCSFCKYKYAYCNYGAFFLTGTVCLHDVTARVVLIVGVRAQNM